MTIGVKFRGVPTSVEYTYTAADFSDRDEPPVCESVEIVSVHTAQAGPGDDVTEWFADEWREEMEAATLAAHREWYKADYAESVALDRDEMRAG